MGGMGASRVASGVTGLLIGLTGDPRPPDDESVGVEDMPSAIALHATTPAADGRKSLQRLPRGQMFVFRRDARARTLAGSHGTIRNVTYGR